MNGTRQAVCSGREVFYESEGRRFESCRVHLNVGTSVCIVTGKLLGRTTYHQTLHFVHRFTPFTAACNEVGLFGIMEG